MTETLRQIVTFEEFVSWKTENGRYELHDGVIVQMSQPLGEHEEITGFLVTKLVVEYERLKLSYFIPKTANFINQRVQSSSI